MNLFESMIVKLFFSAALQPAKNIPSVFAFSAPSFSRLFARFIFFTVVMSIVHPADSDAATLGNIKVTSALGQPFAAEIDISALEGDEFAQIQTRIAGPETYEAAKLEYPTVVRLIRVTTERDGSGDVKSSRAKLKLTSNTAINEPSINLLVEFTTGNGRLVQKYSVLLDLPKLGR